MLLRNPWFASVIERWVLRRADAIICVIEESASRVRSLGVPEKQVTVVRNTPLINRENKPRHHKNKGDSLVIAYLGIVEHHRGVHELVQAVAECRRRGWLVELLVIGDGLGLQQVRELAAELEVLDHGVRLLGRVDNKVALDLLATADIGAIPHQPCDAWNTTIPNKLFDYMSFGLPVLTSNVIPVQRIVLEEGCGVCYASGNVQGLVNAIAVLRSSELRQKMGDAGIKAVESKYNWILDARKLDVALRNVARTPRNSTPAR